MKHRPQDFVFEDCFPKEDAPKTWPRPRIPLLPVLMLAAVAVLVFLLTR